MKIVPLTVTHLHKLYEQGETVLLGELMRDPKQLPSLIDSGPGFAGVDGDFVVGAMGVVKWREGLGLGWGLLPKASGHCMLQIHREARQFLDSCEIKRIEIEVDHGFMPGHRWALMLGFEHEALLRCRLPTGRDCDLYARLRN
jgi:hypothetical protein